LRLTNANCSVSIVGDNVIGKREKLHTEQSHDFRAINADVLNVGKLSMTIKQHGNVNDVEKLGNRDRYITSAVVTQW